MKVLHALYELQTDDGAVLSVANRDLVAERAQPERKAR